MKKLSILLAILTIGLLFSCGGDGKDAGKSTTQSKPAAKKINGAKLYKMNCVICHGADGALGINGAKDITLSELSSEEKMNLIKKGKGVMTAFESILNDAQIKAVVEYTDSL